jgi:hypothetical protein
VDVYLSNPVHAYGILQSRFVDAYPYIRDNVDKNNKAACTLIEGASTPQELLSAIIWILPGGPSDVQACLRLLRLRDDMTAADWKAALHPRRPDSLFTRLVRKLNPGERSS